ncbi:hypothetical protein ATCC90586_011855 [Pythium insidiosum]|nr:hypothetical protein ATCC90586_011855 [Pythium insidiosum]
MDFSKAYDSLDRRFLSLALQRHGFPRALVSAVEALHLGTTARFVVDGDLSTVEEVACGIRQGCPLAPTLFILAADVLYDMLDLDGRLQGLPLSDTTSVTTVGYADDTTVYLDSPDEAPALAECLTSFAAVSGLKVNPAKCTAVFLRRQDPKNPTPSLPFPVAAPDQLVRYLGRQIASAPTAELLWQTSLQHIRARLHLAEIKTTDVLQRVQSGRPLTAADLGPMDGAAAPLSDLLEIQRLSPTMLRFRLRKVSYPYLAVNGFRLLCDTLVICYPDLLLDDLDPDRVRELDLGVVLSHRHAERLARSASGRPRLNLAPHPSTCPTPPLWGTLACFSKRRLRIAVTTPRRERAQQHLKTRTTGLRTSAPLLGAALDQVPLGAAHSLPHSSSRQRLAFYRLPKGKAAPEDPYSTIHLVWQQLVLETIVTILAWRRASDDPDDAWSERRACATHTAMCQQVLRTLSYRLANSRTADPLASRLVDTIRELAIEHPPSEPAPPTPSATSPRLRHVLFFDGGSRGNPGRGGAGAFIVQYAISTATPTVVWSAAMSLAAPTTTNNQAEYHGLLTGLRAAHDHDWHHLDVVGDSALIIRQMSRYRPPRNARLRQLYLDARRLADQLSVANWIHHVRAHNKVADALANLAMDTARSSQVVHPTTRTDHIAAVAHLPGDLAPWLAHLSGGQVENT